MLGDSLPMFFPVLIVSLCIWLIAEQADKFCHRFNHNIARKLQLFYRLLPVIMVLGMIIYRVNAIATRNKSHLEVARRFSGSSFQPSDLIILLTGDGVGETGLFLLLIFAIWSVNLPSLKKSSLATKRLISNRMMTYVSACTLLSFWVFFPESSYYVNDGLPDQPTLPSEGDFHILVVVISILMIAFSAELFALSSINYTEKGLDKLEFRSSIKMYIVLPSFLLLFANSAHFTTDWVAVNNLDKIKMMIIFLSQGLILTLICAPAKSLDSSLGVGEGRTRSFIVMAAITFFMTLLGTAVFINNLPQFDTGNLYLYEAIWLSISLLLLVCSTQILPRYGFDGHTRPEYWWLRFTLVFAPAIIFIMNPLAVFLLPAVWLVASISVVVPSVLEIKAKSPDYKYLILLSFSIILIMTFILFSRNLFSNFILFGPLVVLFPSLLMKFNNRLAV